MNKKTKTIIWIVVVVVAVVLIGILLSDVIKGATELPFNEFLAALKKGEINELYIDAYNWTGYVVNGDGKVLETYTTVAPSVYNYDSFYWFCVDMG